MKRFLRVDPEEMTAHVDDFDSLLGVTADYSEDLPNPEDR
jgi:hypothetical protein